MNHDHLQSEQLKLFLPQEAPSEVGKMREMADTNMAYAQQMTARKQDWNATHPHKTVGFLKSRIGKH
jgi:hypothetical protein